MMDVFCEICGMRWDEEDPGVRIVWATDDRWECVEEVPCSGRRQALETAPMEPGK